MSQRLIVPNTLAEDASVAGVLEANRDSLQDFLVSRKSRKIPLLVCGGGTSSRCAADGHWTIDMRKFHQNFSLDKTKKIVEIGAGINMGYLIRELAKENLSFPIGLSDLTGMGYILTGGISPLSRDLGLAIDQLLEIKGFFTNGEQFVISKPSHKSKNKDKLLWRGLCGAAPFLAIVTDVKLKTTSQKPLKIWKAKLTSQQLAETIKAAEKWPNSSSLQWLWQNDISACVVSSEENEEVFDSLKELEKNHKLSESMLFKKINGLNEFRNFSAIRTIRAKDSRTHSEVIGLLSEEWGNTSNYIVEKIAQLINARPHEKCFIASQQLGGETKRIDSLATSFNFRKAVWKPWINGSWQAGDIDMRNKTLDWMENAWSELEPFCPGIHMAQMHQHLRWHKKELKNAFQEWLPGLRVLKKSTDPLEILPTL